MTDDFQLKPRAIAWINAIKRSYVSQPFTPISPTKADPAEIGGFKMM